ncbi:MAG: 2-phosphosulfolactate phosphatase [Acidimicrobiia bacterium]
MDKPIIIRRSLLTGATGVSGPTIVIDTFRAFSTAAYLFDRGVHQIVLAATLDEARELARSIPRAVLCGEDEGRRPDDFDLGNSPLEVGAHPDLNGAIVVMRTSAGTRGVVAALHSGADPVYAASLVVAAATVTAVRHFRRITIIASGLGGTSIADEDEETADLISNRILHQLDDPLRIDRIRSGAGARRLESTPWIDPADLRHCLDTDRFDFALRAVMCDGIPTLRSEP